MWHKCLENFFILVFAIMNGLSKKSNKLWRKNEFIPIHVWLLNPTKAALSPAVRDKEQYEWS